MERKKEMINQYKENPRPMGVFMVKNNVNNKMLLGASKDVQGAMNRHQFELKFNSHRNKALMKDWKEFGADNFTIEVIDILELSDDPDRDYASELEELLQLRLDEFQPFDDKGYHKAS